MPKNITPGIGLQLPVDRGRAAERVSIRAALYSWRHIGPIQCEATDRLCIWGRETLTEIFHRYILCSLGHSYKGRSRIDQSAGAESKRLLDHDDGGTGAGAGRPSGSWVVRDLPGPAQTTGESELNT